MNETLRSIHRRHSARMFTDRPVGDEDLNVLLDAANRAPSAHNQQVVAFHYPSPSEKAEVGRTGKWPGGRFSPPLVDPPPHGRAEHPERPGRGGRGQYRRVDPPRLRTVPSGQGGGPRFLPHHGDPKFGGAVENLLLAATSLGIGSVWQGILFLMKQDVLRFLGEPAGEFMAVVPLGYPAKTAEGPKKRPLETLIRKTTKARWQADTTKQIGRRSPLPNL
jgi:nitroreductase